jgi:hypothetical protein
MLKNKNFATSSLAAGLTTTGTTLTVISSQGQRFPSSGQFRSVIWASNYFSPMDDPNREIITMELVSGDTFTIIRGQEGTIGKAWSVGSIIAHVITAGKIDEIENAIIGGGAILLRADAVNDEFDTVDGSSNWDPCGSRRIFDRITDKIHFVCRAKSSDGTQIEVKLEVKDEDTETIDSIIKITTSVDEVDLSGEIDISGWNDRCSFVVYARGNGSGGSYAIVNSIFVRLKM